MLRCIVLTLLFVGTCLCLNSTTCQNSQFSMRSGWPSQKVFKTVYTANVQLCTTQCMDHPFCTVAGYDFVSMKCVMATGKYGSCTGTVYKAVDDGLYSILGNNTQLTMGCFVCLDSVTPPSWTRSFQPPNINKATPPTTFLSADDVAYIQKTYATPQCQQSQMNTVYLTPDGFKGRWWGVLIAGAGTQYLKAFLSDMYQQENPGLMALREVSNKGGHCVEGYNSYQDVQFNGKHYWQKTVNYTVDPNVLRWAEAGRTYSNYFSILWNNSDIMVMYYCNAANLNGTCPAGAGYIIVNSRQQVALPQSDVTALNTFLNYTCLSNAGFSYNVASVSDSCVADYANRTSIYYVRSGCDYTNTTWIKEHSTVATYDSLTANPNWAGVNGEWYGQVTVLEFQPEYIAQNKLFVPMYRQQTNQTSSCTIINTTAWLINDTAKDIPGFFPTENLWVQTANVTYNVSNAANTLFWRIAHDGVIASTISCVGAVPCKNASSAFAGGSRRYRKSSVFIFRVRLYPAIALGCIDPSVIDNCPAIRAPQLDCGKDRDNKTCLNSDLSKQIFPTWNMAIMGNWVLNLVQSVQGWQAMACTITQSSSNSNALAFSCYIKTLGLCTGPNNISVVQQSNKGNFTWTFQDPIVGTYSENLQAVWQSENVIAFYGCSFNGEDNDGTCRDDKMYGLVFTKWGYTLSATDLTQVQNAFNNVCLWTVSQLFPANTNDECFKPLGWS